MRFITYCKARYAHISVHPCCDNAGTQDPEVGGDGQVEADRGSVDYMDRAFFLWGWFRIISDREDSLLHRRSEIEDRDLAGGSWVLRMGLGVVCCCSDLLCLVWDLTFMICVWMVLTARDFCDTSLVA